MSASDKKKLRKELAAEKLTERQLQEQKEAKKTKIYTISFIVAMALILVVAVGIMAAKAVEQSGIFQKTTIAANVGEEQLNSIEFNYYFNDAVSEYYNNWYTEYQTYTDAYLEVMGLSVTKPLNEQVQDEETGATWADFFTEMALENAKNDFTLCALAEAEGYTLTEEDQEQLDTVKTNLETYAQISGLSIKQYLRSVYGNGAEEKSYFEYLSRSMLADSFYNNYLDTLTYTESDINDYQKDKESNYDAYTYTSSYLSHTDFIEGGTENAEGQIEYSEDEKAAAREAAKAAAEKLATGATADEMREIAKEIKVNETSQVAVNDYKNQIHTGINATLSNWLADDARTEGEIGVIPNINTATDADGNTTETVNGYYVVIFGSKTDNNNPMTNVRHLLVSFEGGTEDPDTLEMTYSAEEKAAAKEKADEYLKQWKEGEATEDSFIALVQEHSDDTTAETGGLFEDVHAGSNYVPSFLNWSIDASRKEGDVEIIESEFGYHIMYFVSHDEYTYREQMIIDEMREADLQEWYDGVMETATGSIINNSRLNNDLVISPSY